ncbi:MAG: ImmA/IrrE family metallo-endopeptidase [Planctomycetota bacterium]
MLGELAECTLAEAGVNKAPVDLFRVIKEERIFAVGNDYGDAFDGRVEWRGDHFNLYYNTKYGDEDNPRVRFSIAHEIAHCVVPHHRDALKKSIKAHSSFSERYLDDFRVEKEADEFAANLLLPKFLFAEISHNPPDLAKISQAARRFRTSLQSTARRCVETSDFACLMFVSDGHRVKWHFRNQQFIDTGATGLGRGYKLPASSVTVQLASGQSEVRSLGYVEELIDTDEWFSFYRCTYGEVLEQCMPMGEYGFLTLLCVEEPD